MNRLQKTIQEIIDDIDARDFKNCKKDCYGTNCKYIEECSWYHYKHREKFALEGLLNQFRVGVR